MKTLFSRFTKRERSLFMVTMCVALGLGLYIVIMEPLYKKWAQLGVKFEAANSKLFKNLKLLANREAIEKEYEQYKDYVQKAGVDEEEVASVLREIESTALSCGVRITGIKPKGIKQLKDYKRFSVEVVSEARINEFLKFIYDLEGSKKLLKVERLVLSLRGAQSDLLKGTIIIRKISF